MSCWRRCSSILVKFRSSRDSFNLRWAPATFDPLPLKIVFCLPRRPVKFRRASLKESVVSEWAISMWTALTAKHANRQPSCLTWLLPRFTHNGRNIHPCTGNQKGGWPPDIHSADSSDMIWWTIEEFRLLHKIHDPNILRSVAALLSVQYRWRRDDQMCDIPEWPTTFWCYSTMSRVTWCELGKIMGCSTAKKSVLQTIVKACLLCIQKTRSPRQEVNDMHWSFSLTQAKLPLTITWGQRDPSPHTNTIVGSARPKLAPLCKY